MNRPSPRGDRADRDLLAQARLRLPPEVDVVELAGPATSEGNDVNPLTKVAAPVLAGAVVLSGCSPSPSEIRAAATSSKARVMDVSHDVLDEATATGRLFAPAEGMWRSCRDKAGWLQYFVAARLDPMDEAGEALVNRVSAALEPAGYRLQVVDDNGEVLTLEAVTGEVNVQLTGYANDPFVLFDISGGCVEVADLDGEYRSELPETLE